MSYTNAWSDTIPLGTELASHIDDQIRQLRLDIHDRMNTLVVDWTADPIVLKTIAGSDTQRYIPAQAFFNNQHAKENDLINNQISAFCGNGPYVAPLSAFLPNGITITDMQVWIGRDAATSVTATLMSETFNVPGDTTAPNMAAVGGSTTLTTSSGGIQTMHAGSLTIVLDPLKMYILSIDATGTSGNSYEIYGAMFTFHF